LGYLEQRERGYTYQDIIGLVVSEEQVFEDLSAIESNNTRKFIIRGGVP